MCDFKPGDEVVCVDASPSAHTMERILVKGAVYRVNGFLCGFPTLEGVPNPLEIGWRPSRFRKVQRRDLSAWLATAHTIEEPKRAPAKERA